MRYLVRIVRGQVHTRDVRLEAESLAAAKAKIVADLAAARFDDGAGWLCQSTHFDYECEEDEGDELREGAAES